MRSFHHQRTDGEGGRVERGRREGGREGGGREGGSLPSRVWSSNLHWDTGFRASCSWGKVPGAHPTPLLLWSCLCPLRDAVPLCLASPAPEGTDGSGLLCSDFCCNKPLKTC